jgi:glutamyl-tRNA synthetase
MSHIPLIHGADGAKLSKRHGALGVDSYRAMGYLPEALRNYLVRLGWSHGDQEVCSTQEMIDLFDLEHIGRSPARFDFTKLESLNGHYMRHTDDERLIEAIEVILPEIGPARGLTDGFAPELRQKLLRSMPGLKERAKTLVELLDSASYLYEKRPLSLDEKAARLLDDDARKRLMAMIPRLEALSVWSAQSTEEATRTFAEEAGVKLGQVAQPLRAALTGKATSPGLFDVMEVLGREECLGRLRDQGPS